MRVPRLIIAGTQSGVGKTTVTLALLGALMRRGQEVQAFKVGPDFIDPGHHAAVTKRSSRNLDGWMLDVAANGEILARAAQGVDLCVIEGTMGLFDGSSAVSEEGSTAAMAKLIQAPVLLVVDGSAMARSAAAMVAGYSRFDPDLRVAGVLFNRVNGAGHFRLLKEAVEHATDVAVVGYLPRHPDGVIEERHLGLVTAREWSAASVYSRLADAVSATVDMDHIEAIARSAPDLLLPGDVTNGVRRSRKDCEGLVRIGVALDEAFCFYYQDNLEWLEYYGAKLVYFSPLHDRALPDVDGLYLGGGYPEVHAATLAHNRPMREAIRAFAERGGPIYAECGGMMYLTRTIRDLDNRSHEMVGFFPAEAVMQKAGLTLGYRSVTLSRNCIAGNAGLVARGHEFHYSTLIPTGQLDYACMLTDAGGESSGPDGLVAGNTLALYTHLHFSSRPEVAESLVAAARRSARGSGAGLQGEK